MWGERFRRRDLAKLAGAGYISADRVKQRSLWTPDPNLVLRIRSLYYHNIPSFDWLVKDVLTIRRQGYRPIRQQEIVRRLAGDPNPSLIPKTDGKRFAVFIDDSWKEHFPLARYLVTEYPKRVRIDLKVDEELEVVLAVITKLAPTLADGPEGPLEKLPLTRKLYPDTRNLTYGTIGDCLSALELENILLYSHLPDHPHLTALDQAGINSQLDTGVERILGFHSLAERKVPVIGVVYPYGEYDARVLDHMADIEAGIRTKQPNAILVGYGTAAEKKSPLPIATTYHENIEVK